MQFKRPKKGGGKNIFSFVILPHIIFTLYEFVRQAALTPKVQTYSLKHLSRRHKSRSWKLLNRRMDNGKKSGGVRITARFDEQANIECV